MYKLIREAFDHEYCTAVSQALLESECLGDSPLGPEFVRTKGFSILFRRSALEDVCQAFPYMERFLSEAIFKGSNAFYVNPVLMEGGSRVDPHIDCRLVASENVRIIPNLVSIFYVSAAAHARGGDFRFHLENGTLLSVRPHTGDLMHFVGQAIHSVGELEEGFTRTSLVCEQYNLADELLAGFPEFELLRSSEVAPRVGALA